jgi:hypothetical protein
MYREISKHVSINYFSQLLQKLSKICGYALFSASTTGGNDSN